MKLPLDDHLSYEQPQWSPDGKSIAMVVRSKWGDRIQGLSVYDVETRTVVANLEGEYRKEDWYWSDDSEFILVARGTSSNETTRIEIFYWQGNRTKTVPLPSKMSNNYNAIKAIGFE